MSRARSAALTVATFVVVALLFVAPLARDSLAQTPTDRSEIVLVLDLSGSILVDVANRDRFAAALDRLADRVDLKSSDLVAGDTTVSVVEFASRAADVTGCVNLKLLNSPPTVARFAECLRSVAKAYRKGIDSALTKLVGIDTNYVAAMEKAARHLPAGASRPALILFTDGKHDVAGVPASQVQPARNRLFGTRPTFALLPVGMGLQSTERAALEKGLVNLRIIRNMPACVSGAKFEWPQVVFQSPDDAGNAVGVALQDVTCTFTVAPPTPTPTPPPAPTPTPVPTPGAVRSLNLTAGDGRIEVSWAAPATTAGPVIGYRLRCRTGGGDWTQLEVDSRKTSAVIDGLTDGAAYECEVAAVDASSEGAWTPASATATPLGRPAAPARPTVEALDRAVRIQVPPADPSIVSGFHYECSSDGGASWPDKIDVASAEVTSAEIGNLANGKAYTCRAFAVNAIGRSDPSEASAALGLCGSLFECNPVVAPVLGIFGFLALVGILAVLLALFRGRTRGYVVAVLDVVHSVNLGQGSKLGIRVIRTRPGGPVTGIVADSSKDADFHIRLQGGERFEVTDKDGRHVATSGQPLMTIDTSGARHELVLRRFRTATASPVTGRG